MNTNNQRPDKLNEEEVAAVTACISDILDGGGFKIRSFKRVHIYKWQKYAKRDAVARNSIFNNNWR